MLTVLALSALAHEPAPAPEAAPPPPAAPDRLEGVHLGLGMSFYLVTTSVTSLQAYSGVVGRSSVSARLRLSPDFTLAPSLRVSSSSSRTGRRMDDTDEEPHEESTNFGVSAGIDTRFRMAKHAHMDLVGIVGVFGEGGTLKTVPTTQSEHETISEGLGGSLELGLGLEYWITREISVGADVSATVLSAWRSQDDPEFDEELWFGLSPSSGASLTLYF